MPTPTRPLTSEKCLAVVSSAVLFALLDKMLAKGVLDRVDIQDVLKTAKGCVNARATSFCGPEASDLMKSLCQRYAQEPVSH